MKPESGQKMYEWSPSGDLIWYYYKTIYKFFYKPKANKKERAAITAALRL